MSKTVLELIKLSSEHFKSKNISSPKISAEYLLAKTLNKSRMQLHLDPNYPLNEGELGEFRSLCRKRLNREPLQYLIGNWDFYNLNLIVEAPTLIPRPETEELVDIIIKSYGEKYPKCILDIGSGSGAIVLSLLKNWPEAKGYAVDCCDHAINLTAKNSGILGLNDRLELFHGEFCNFELKNKGFDLVVSNPPYIPKERMPQLAPEILNYEDHKALNGGENGLEVVEGIFEHLQKNLIADQTQIWLELDEQQPKIVEDWCLRGKFNRFQWKENHQDLTGRLRFCHLNIN